MIRYLSKELTKTHKLLAPIVIQGALQTVIDECLLFYNLCGIKSKCCLLESDPFKRDRRRAPSHGFLNWTRGKTLRYLTRDLRKINSTAFHRMYQRTQSRKNHSFLLVFANCSCIFMNMKNWNKTSGFP